MKRKIKRVIKKIGPVQENTIIFLNGPGWDENFLEVFCLLFGWIVARAVSACMWRNHKS